MACRTKQKRKGFALIVAMTFVCIFGTLLAGFVSMTNLNAQISHNERKTNCALAGAESGLDLVRFLFSDVTISSGVEPDDRLYFLDICLRENLAAAKMYDIVDKYEYDGSAITIEDVPLDSQTNQTFSVAIQQINDDTVQVDISGSRDQVTRNVRANFDFTSTRSSLFDYGVASRGPLFMNGNVELQGVNFSSEADVYIESSGTDEALTMIGNSDIEGDVSIGNPDAYVDISGNSTIGGESGQAAIDNHVYIGVDVPEFPVPNLLPFEQYIQNIIDGETQTVGNKTFQNVRIIAGTNPSFSGNITFNGIIFVESPNIISFSGNVTITGMVVADGDAEFPYSTDSLSFTGNLYTYDCSYLPEGEDFDGLRSLTSSFLLAPGFSISFGGNFHTIGGVIAGNGISFSGNAGGTINGTVINYSEDAISLSGNPTLDFSLPQTGESPAGFSGNTTLEFNPGSYAEIVL
jgi:hypothetical protein